MAERSHQTELTSRSRQQPPATALVDAFWLPNARFAPGAPGFSAAVPELCRCSGKTRSVGIKVALLNAGC
jgi:hypothetical protein